MLNLKVDRLFERLPILKEAGQKVARAIHGQVLAAGEPARDVADILHGTWLGHPLHPVLTDVVVGAFSLGGLLDLASVMGGGDSARKAADVLTTIGAASAVPTAVSGLTDFSTIPGGAAGHGLVHALANTTALLLYLLSLAARRNGRRGKGIALSTAGMGVITAGAYLGGHLVFGKKVGVDHTERVTEPQDWVSVMNESDLLHQEPVRVEAAGNGVLLYRNADRVLAVGATCPHAGGPLEEGAFYGGCVQCPWHDSVFNLEDGSVVHGPATYALPVYEARLRNGRVEVRLVRPA
jgi:nitrite reductase/ring-hydroxylating ferredoxin subunit/uncharacterized membrane protein